MRDDVAAASNGAEATGGFVPSGIGPLDERVGGLQSGGTYLVVGPPGPAKMVSALQFLAAGLSNGEQALLLTNSDAASTLDVARAWGFDLTAAWESGHLQILGFRDDFELRAMRSIEPEEVIEELEALTTGEPTRIAIDPGSLFLTGGARTLLGSAFMAWARSRPATVLTTFSVDGAATHLPSAADWLINATTARLALEPRQGSLYQVSLLRSTPAPGERDEAITLELEPGQGLVAPTSLPARRGADRGDVDSGRLLLVSLDAAHATDMEAWANRAFQTDLVQDPLAAVARVQEVRKHGCVIVHAPRQRVREAVKTCRALRPLTKAAIVFASDDAIRSTDRIQLLEAGADDCLSGGLDFRELGLRIKQAVAAGAKPALPRAEHSNGMGLVPDGADRGRVDRKLFISEVQRRAESSELTFFCVLTVQASGLDVGAAADVVGGLVRSDEGDLVCVDDGRCLALLQGAREGQVQGFLDRLEDALVEDGAKKDGVTIDVAGHPTDADAIGETLGTTVAAKG